MIMTSVYGTSEFPFASSQGYVSGNFKRIIVITECENLIQKLRALVKEGGLFANEIAGGFRTDLYLKQEYLTCTLKYKSLRAKVINSRGPS